MAQRIGGPVAIKAQVWETGRAQAGLIRFADTPAEAAEAAQEIFNASVDGHRIDSVLVEKRLVVEREFYLSLVVDDRIRRPVLLLSTAGGVGIEERARTHPTNLLTLPVSVKREPAHSELLQALAQTHIPTQLQPALATVLLKLYRTARSLEARIAEINPLALTNDGRLVALDCRISIDDYAVFRHAELGIEVAREFGHLPTRLEKVAWDVEKDDYRGTFYFVELRRDYRDPGIFIGFHGAGGGGSMASLDAALAAGLRPADYTDTSGNPPASKVYRAARIILAQPGIRGYLLSGSGVASQEQFHLARALVKAFREEGLSIPAVLRFGGNGEELAAKIVREYTADLPAQIEVYRGKDGADFCARRLADLIKEEDERPAKTETPERGLEATAQPPDAARTFRVRQVSDLPQAPPYSFGASPTVSGRSPEGELIRLPESRRLSAHPAAQPPATENFTSSDCSTTHPPSSQLYTFLTRTGRITYDHAICAECESKACVKECVPQILSLEGGLPVLNISRDDAERGKCIECLACEVECWFQGKGGASIDLPIAGLEEYRRGRTP